jgi:hypothetical protein
LRVRGENAFLVGDSRELYASCGKKQRGRRIETRFALLEHHRTTLVEAATV